MSFTVPAQTLRDTNSSALAQVRNLIDDENHPDREIHLDPAHLQDGALRDLVAAAERTGDRKTAQAASAILQARGGEFGQMIPNFKAFQGILESFLRHEIIDGWIYVRHNDGELYPELVTRIEFDPGENFRHREQPSVTLYTCAYSLGREAKRGNKYQMVVQSYGHRFEPQDVTRKRIADALAASGIYKETVNLKRDYETAMARHWKIVPEFARQFRLRGRIFFHEDTDWQKRGQIIDNHKVIHDLAGDEYGALSHFIQSSLFQPATPRPKPAKGRKAEGSSTDGRVPEHPLIRVFDLRTYEFLWLNTGFLEPYEYDLSLRDKLVLPDTHRDLLDVLTADIEVFATDIIEGKTAGNIILCKGVPGVGKTLTAEVYAELTRRPLYMVQSGMLGTDAESVGKTLELIFHRAKRWNCTLALDEADVFILRRRDDIRQNAIVAEFLRALEYFDGLLFMTTNRPDDIDEAIISRCAAIVEYEVPDRKLTARIWRVMATQFGAEISDGLLIRLLDMFPGITPRDIKMLFRLVLRMAGKRGEAISSELFRQCAMFRAIETKDV